MSSPVHWPCWDHPWLLSMRSHNVQSAPRGAGHRAELVLGLSSPIYMGLVPASTPGTSHGHQLPSGMQVASKFRNQFLSHRNNQHYPPWINFSLSMDRKDIFYLPSYKKTNLSELLQHRKYKKFFLGDKRNRKFVYYLCCSDAVGHLHYVLLLASPALHPTGALTSHRPMGKL